MKQDLRNRTKMLKVGIEILRKDFRFKIGYNRRAFKTYSDVLSEKRNDEPECPQTTNTEPTNEQECSDTDVVS